MSNVTDKPVTAVTLPLLSDSMEEGTIARWLKTVGEPVAVGDPLVEVETDKAVVAYEAEVAGTLLQLLAQEGETVAVGAGVAWIGAPGAEIPQAPPTTAPTATPQAATAPAPAAADPAPAAASGRIRVSPLARRRAETLGIALATIRGTGPNGRIVKADVEAAGAARDAAPGPAPTAAGHGTAGPAPDAAATGRGTGELLAPTTLQRTVARRMAESKATIPHFHVSAEIDMTHAREARARLRASARDGERVPSFNDMVVKACALALRAVPLANASWTDGGIALHGRVNVGIAVAADGALTVPTIFDADRKGLKEIAAETAALAGRVRAGTIAPPELAHGTFTVSNLGMHGVDDFAAIVNPPQAAILAVGAIAERPFARDGELVLAPTMRATLACDHRVLYGAEAAALLAHVRRLLEEPLGLAG